jgi:hypothetical protein
MKIAKCILLVLLLPAFSNSYSQLKIGDQPTVRNKSVVLDLQGSANQQGLWLPRVIDTSITGIRALNPPDGLVIYHTPTSGVANNKILLRSNNSWVSYLTNAITGITSGQTTTGPNITLQTGNSGTDHNIVANAATNTITLNIPDASTTARGAVTIASQTFGGAKTFANGITVNNGAVVNGGTTANNGLTVTGATSEVSNLTLGITSATTPAAAANSYLSVNSLGQVTLNTVPVNNTPITQATSTASATTTSTTFTVINNDMTVTPGAGDYLVFFTASVWNSNNGKGASFAIFKNGVEVTASEVLVETSGGATSSVATNAYITSLTAGQSIDVRWKVTANTETIFQRSLIVQRVK